MTSTPLTPPVPEAWNRSPADASPREILRWAVQTFPSGELVLSTSFGVGGIVLIHLLQEEGIRLPVIFVDTLHHFPETVELAEVVRRRFDLDLRVVKPAPDLAAFEATHGARLWERDVDRFHRITKVDPMAEALSGSVGWITARRRDQSETRARLPLVEPGRTGGRTKINPLAFRTEKEIWALVRAHDLPYNPLHDQRYRSIGDAPLTVPVDQDEDERAGRWRGSERTECGLHLRL